MYKIIDGNITAREDGKPVYTVTIGCRYGVITQTASPCNEDLDWHSNFIGFDIALYKCEVELYKRKSEMMYQRAMGVKQAYDAIVEKYHSYNLTDSETFLEPLKHQLDVAEREYRIIREEYNNRKNSLNDFVEYKHNMVKRSIELKELLKEKE